jgi:hypothetical protein
MSKTTNMFAPEFRDRAVQEVLEHSGEHLSRWAVVVSVASKFDCAARTLNGGSRKRGLTAAGAPASLPIWRTSPRRWNGRNASCVRRTKFFTMRKVISHRWSSTARSSGDRIHHR